MRQDLESSLCIRLMSKFDKDASSDGSLASSIADLSRLSFGDKCLQSSAGPVDGVYLLPNQAKLAKPVGWAPLIWYPAGCQRACKFSESALHDR
jgi:hypothetical protein